MPDFDTRKPQGSGERNSSRVSSTANRLRGLLTASKLRTLSMANTLRSSFMANRRRSLLLSGVLLCVMVAVPVGLLIYSSSGGDHQQLGSQRGERTVSDMQE